MKKFTLVVTTFLLALAMLACSSSTGGGGGGGTREFDSGNLNNGDSFTHTFTTTGSFPYYCQYHGGPGGSGMSGTVTVSAAGTGYVPKTVAVSITSSSLPDLAITAGDSVEWTNNSGIAHTVESDN